MKWRPSGRKVGKRWAVSWRDASSAVTGDICPPEAETRRIGPVLAEKTITLSRFQEPPVTAAGRLPMGCAAPPGTAIFLSLPDDWKARNLLSGDQNGWRTPACVSDSDPARGVAATESKG